MATSKQATIDRITQLLFSPTTDCVEIVYLEWGLKRLSADNLCQLELLIRCKINDAKFETICSLTGTQTSRTQQQSPMGDIAVQMDNLDTIEAHRHQTFARNAIPPMPPGELTEEELRRLASAPPIVTDK
jgi:hypothetical protein